MTSFAQSFEAGWTMDDLCPICQADGQERKEEASLVCCKKAICRDCLVAWQQNSNLCPLCKTPFQNKEEARRSTLAALHQQVVGVNRLLQKVASLSDALPVSDPCVPDIVLALDDVFHSALKLGFGPPSDNNPNPNVHSREILTLDGNSSPGGQLFSREILSFALAALVGETSTGSFSIDVSAEESWTDSDGDSSDEESSRNAD